MKASGLYIAIVLLVVSLFPVQGMTSPSSQSGRRNKADRIRNQMLSQRQDAVQWARQRGYAIRRTQRTGEITELQRILQGFPVYYVTQNRISAETISTDHLWAEGLTGSGMMIGEWDGGDVLSTHQELDGRIVDMDGATSVISHATAVAGVLAAAGVEANARGMASAATVHTYDWTDDFAEMLDAVANDDILVSNHSYGPIVGWSYGDFHAPPTGTNNWYWFGDINVDGNESVYFGWYNSDAQTLDDIAYTSPHYLIVTACGNDRGEGPSSATGHYAWDAALSDWVWATADRPQDGQYDCLHPLATSKNGLAVGAIGDIAGGYTQPSDASMLSFSSWGPTDDGRIKPDVVANGEGLYTTSPSSNTAYTSATGTSYATPSAAGSMLLLQEHHSALFSGALLSSTVKALAVHTADEAGPAGPDYQFGWGVLNINEAKTLISRDQVYPWVIQERTLTDNSTHSVSLISDGIEPIKVTLVWTDPPGVPVSPSTLDNSTPMLVNDLDLTLYQSSLAFEPWILDSDQPSNPAVRGNNSVDNVEQVWIESPSPGEYELVIEHKGSLSGGSQQYSLIVTGLSRLDFGDAPDSPYPTYSTQNGASHAIDGVTFLGNRVDADPEGQPSPHALGDDQDLTPSDEDGVVFNTALIPAQQAQLDITASAPGILNAWIDMNRDGQWQSTEQIFTDATLSAGTQTLSFSIPSDASTGVTFARFRYSQTGGLAPTGHAPDGEVEDYQTSIQTTSEIDSDMDTVPDALEGSMDRDGDGIPNALDYDPTGYFYDSSSGEILTGGSITVTPSEHVTILYDGSTGFYQFLTDGTSDTYILQISPPTGYELDTSCSESASPFDPTGMTDPVVLGAGEEGQTGFLTSSDCVDNVYYLSFDLEGGDPYIINNNIPLRNLIPIELSSFTATCHQGRVELNWTTQSETDNLGFHIYRSAGETEPFFRITKSPVPGEGNSNSVHDYRYMDHEVQAGKSYRYQLSDIDYSGLETLHSPISVTVVIPQGFSLEQNYPNPFNPETTIEFSLSASGPYRLQIFNLQGQLIKSYSDTRSPGRYKIIWRGRDESGKRVSSGIYLYRLICGGRSETRKMNLLR